MIILLMEKLVWDYRQNDYSNPPPMLCGKDIIMTMIMVVHVCISYQSVACEFLFRIKFIESVMCWQPKCLDKHASFYCIEK